MISLWISKILISTGFQNDIMRDIWLGYLDFQDIHPTPV
jgi:hypothetical protein